MRYTKTPNEFYTQVYKSSLLTDAARLRQKKF